MSNEQLEQERTKKDELCRSYSDAKLQELYESETYSGEWHRAASREIIRRKNQKDNEAQQTKRRIKQIAFWTFVVTIVILILTLIQLFKQFHASSQ